MPSNLTPVAVAQVAAPEASPPDPDAALALARAALLERGADRQTAIRQLHAVIDQPTLRTPEHQLLLGDLLQASDQPRAALVAWAHAVSTAQCSGAWHGKSTTPAHLLASVSHAVDQVRQRRRELYFASYDSVRLQHGDAALERVDQALSAHLKDWDGGARPAGQRPRFFFFPGLNKTPYLDPWLHPWTQHLVADVDSIRQEAMTVLNTGAQWLEDFVRLRPNDRMDNYLAGQAPSWEAFFFYRHGQRFDDNHLRCPATSRALESVDLCRISQHAPEICFSVLAPQTTIRPHFGVTNVRSVLHLPLLVPPDCALHVLGHPPHVWREGEPMMFDDSFEHAAWNRSDVPRVILLMDCWNPLLSAPERAAVTALIEMIGAMHRAAAAVA